ncbi:MAG: acylphosphatase [Terriglobia bacterium]
MESNAKRTDHANGGKASTLICASNTVKRATKYLISGRVQGVGYRFFAERVANQLGLAGYVRNLADGNVEAYAIGDEVRLEEFRRHLEKGPFGARVTGVETSEAPVNSRYKQFVIEGTW